MVPPPPSAVVHPDEDTMTLPISRCKPVGTLEAFDSHFHPDRTARAMHLATNAACRSMGLNLVPQIFRYRLNPPPLNTVKLLGLVAVFCDPDTYPFDLVKASQLKAAIGFHPKLAERFDDSHFYEVQRLLCSSMAVALGEVGLDYSMPKKVWEKQKAVLRQLLQLCCVGRVLVLHLRPSVSTDMTVFRDALEIVRLYCTQLQPIHLHCFTGNAQVVKDWLAPYPLCHFGFTAKAAQFSGPQQAALQSIPYARVLLETDAPYMPPQQAAGKTTINSPLCIGDVAACVAPRFGMSTKQLVDLTTANGRKLYRF